MHRPGSRALRTLLLLSVALAAPLALADDKPMNQTQFKAVFGDGIHTTDTFQAGHAISKLNPDLKADYELLKFCLQYGTWYLRGEAIAVLSKGGNDEIVKDMLDSLSEKKEKNVYIREGMVTAIAKKNDKNLFPQLFKALDDKEGKVRREVAYVLRYNKDKSSIDALIARWKVEKDPLVANTIRATLEDITKRFAGPHAADWESWWLAVKDSFEVGSTDEEAKKKAEEDGKALSAGSTSTRDADLEFVSRGVGAPVVVLPHYGQSKELMIPFFIDVEKFAKVYYMDLPAVSKFKNLKAVGSIPFYPIDQMVDSLEEFRKQTKADRIAIVSCGLTSWIGMRYATKYPKNCAALIFIAPISSEQEYGRASDRMKKQGEALQPNDLELVHLSMTRSFNPQNGKSTHDIYHEDKKIPVPEGEREALGRKDFTIYFGDEQDSFLEELFPTSVHDPGEIAIPDFKVFKEPATGVPVLVMIGAHSIYASAADCQEIAKHYGAQSVMFDKSADLPLVEEPERFEKAVKEFLTKAVGKAKEKK